MEKKDLLDELHDAFKQSKTMEEAKMKQERIMREHIEAEENEKNGAYYDPFGGPFGEMIRAKYDLVEVRDIPMRIMRLRPKGAKKEEDKVIVSTTAQKMADADFVQSIVHAVREEAMKQWGIPINSSPEDGGNPGSFKKGDTMIHKYKGQTVIEKYKGKL